MMKCECYHRDVAIILYIKNAFVFLLLGLKLDIALRLMQSVTVFAEYRLLKQLLNLRLTATIDGPASFNI